MSQEQYIIYSKMVRSRVTAGDELLHIVLGMQYEMMKNKIFVHSRINMEKMDVISSSTFVLYVYKNQQIK